ncbi:MAG: hypothetical protein Q9214_002726 [Letrouitia sp. 1 TL-2023]
MERQTAAAAQIPPWRREDPAQAADDNAPEQAARAVALDLYRQRQGQGQQAAAAARAPTDSPASSSSAPAPQAEEMQPASSRPTSSRRASGLAVSTAEASGDTFSSTAAS